MVLLDRGIPDRREQLPRGGSFQGICIQHRYHPRGRRFVIASIVITRRFENLVPATYRLLIGVVQAGMRTMYFEKLLHIEYGFVAETR